MKNVVCLLIFIIYSFLLINEGNSLSLEINSAKVVQAAEFAVQELSKLSDSGIYETLQLSKILSADEIDGLFHINLLLHLELMSPYFASRNLREDYHMIVMYHKEDNITTLAIDEFPVMKEEAIEEFYIRRVEHRREMREKAFEELELDALAMLEEIEKGELDEESLWSLQEEEDEENERTERSGGREKRSEASINSFDGTAAFHSKPSEKIRKEKEDGKEKKDDLEDLPLEELHNLLKKLNSN